MTVNPGDSSIMGFCDGHSEIRKWRNSFTKEREDKLITQGVTNCVIEYLTSDQKEDNQLYGNSPASSLQKMNRLDSS